MGEDQPNPLGLKPARRTVVVLVDGLGAELLRAHGGHAPTLQRAQKAASSTVLDSVFPSTTAAALTSLATGATPSQHGIVGYDSFDPERRRVVNQLGGWPGDLDSLAWQPVPTLFETLHPARTVVTVSRPKFKDSALTKAGLRGGLFVEATSPTARVQHTLSALKEHRDVLVYLYWDDLDKAGHGHGTGSRQWLDALEELDGAMRRLVSKVDDGTRVVLTADHGMVDVAPEGRVDYAQNEELLGGVEFTAGEPRAVQLHFSCDASAGQREETAAAWRRWMGKDGWVLTREQVRSAGWFGPTWREGVEGRVGDLVIAVRGPLALFDGRRVAPHAFEMVGQHGSLTEAERRVPLLRLAN